MHEPRFGEDAGRAQRAVHTATQAILELLWRERPFQMGWQHVCADVVANAEACDLGANGENCASCV